MVINSKDQTNHNDFSHIQDVLGSLPMIKRYIVLCLCFPLSTSTSTSAVFQDLRLALDKLGQTFPFLKGRVVYDGRDETHSGTTKVVPYKDSIELITNDLSSKPEWPSMDELSSANYPFSMLPLEALAPRLAETWIGSDYDMIAPAMVLQANFVKGGLLLVFTGNHTLMDMTGMGMIISHFAKVCRGETFTKIEIQQGNQSRRDAVPLFDKDYSPGPEMEDIMARNFSMSAEAMAQVPRWVYFNISSTNLLRLKQEASKQTIVPYISTDDAIVAFCWQHITKARFDLSIVESKTVTQFCRPISVRNYLGLKGYMGHMVDCIYERESAVWERSLGEIAGRIRQGLFQDDIIRQHIRGFATIMDRLDDKGQVVNGAVMDFTRDLCISSYGNSRCCELSFGPVLGQPEAARRPNFPTRGPSASYVMPKARNGDVAVGLCLLEEEIGKLRENKAFLDFAEYVG